MSTEYPTSDDQFEESRIDGVKPEGGSYVISIGGWSLFCGYHCPIVPQPGMVARKYGHGIGAPVRGLFINGERFWYRTEAEDKEHHEIQMYGADAADWLNRWDAGKGVWTIEMGGLGPGYEQCIHITGAEILRWLLEHKPNLSDETVWPSIRDQISDAVASHSPVKELGLSGAQWGAACSIAAALYRRGPRAVMADEQVKDRHIQVSRDFPHGFAA
jgi:hypothetical protein